MTYGDESEVREQTFTQDGPALILRQYRTSDLRYLQTAAIGLLLANLGPGFLFLEHIEFQWDAGGNKQRLLDTRAQWLAPGKSTTLLDDESRQLYQDASLSLYQPLFGDGQMIHQVTVRARSSSHRHELSFPMAWGYAARDGQRLLALPDAQPI